MSKTVFNFWLDVLLLCIFLAIITVALVIQFVFPPAGRADGWLLLGRDYATWWRFEFGLLCVFTLGVLLHVMMHWSWVCGVIASRIARKNNSRRWHLEDGTRTLVGVATLIILLHIVGAGVAAAALLIEAPQL